MEWIDPQPTQCNTSWAAIAAVYGNTHSYCCRVGHDRVAEYKAARIPGAKFFDIDGVCLPGVDLPHMLPSKAAFAAAADALGINNDDTVVVYDGMGMFSAPRVWWTFKVFGHDRVYVLEGGFPAWKSLGLPIYSSPMPNDDDRDVHVATRAAQAPPPQTKYKATIHQDKLRNIDQMLALASAATASSSSSRGAAEQVMDARSAGRFRGVDPEPRAGLRRGHMPGARSVPFQQVYEKNEMKGAALKSKEQLAAVFQQAGVDLSQPVVATCGSGLTACVLALAVHELTGRLVPVYDGSWSEWGARQDTPIDSEAQQA
eukprot:jgi/Chrzof1/2063/Cz11g01160.t1